jgi:hypothetical protein
MAIVRVARDRASPYSFVGKALEGGELAIIGPISILEVYCGCQCRLFSNASFS